jgi:acyl-CoA synthetase (AMP-forming)/AMP-acid ligase II
MDERGYCRIGGRLKDMIIRGGENIYPREIEQVLFEHEDVADVAVVGIPDPVWGEQVAAVVRPAAGRTPDPDVLFAYCRERRGSTKTDVQPKVAYLPHDVLPLVACQVSSLTGRF